MRRGLASLILGLSLLAASVAWSGFVLLHTALDPGRSERLADQMLDNDVLRRAMVDAVADSLAAGVPDGVEVPRQQLEAAADAALEDPRVAALVRDGLVRIHQNALNGVDEPVVLDPSVLGTAARDALVGVRPELGGVLPAAPAAQVTLPDPGLGFLGTVRDLLERAVALTALGAVAGAGLALLIARNRPGVLRRVALWAFAASAFWLVLGFGVPWLTERLAPSSTAVFAAAIDVFLGAMIPPALALAGAGAVLLVLSVLWDTAARRPAPTDRPARPAPAPAPARATARPASPPVAPAPRVTPTDHTVAMPQPWVMAGARSGSPPPDQRWAPEPSDRADDATRVGPAWEETAWAPSAADPTRDQPTWRSEPAAAASDDAAGPDDPTRAHPVAERRQPSPEPGPEDRDERPRTSPPGPRWVEGIGYLED